MFTFTLKNPSGTEPTQYLMDTISVILCSKEVGPCFYENMLIENNCNNKNSCQTKRSDLIDKKATYALCMYDFMKYYSFSVLDYEVYCIDKYMDYIDHVCKHSDIIREYIETKDISEESLKQIDDDRELLTDLDTINCDDNSLRLKVSRSCLKNPSEFLPDTQLVDKKYDSYLKEWAGDYNMKLIYRSSEHEYSGESFHEFCDDKGPTLVIIKSSGGWLFGGYTTQSWSGDGIYYKNM